jgi:magnesium transporter
MARPKAKAKARTRGKGPDPLPPREPVASPDPGGLRIMAVRHGKELLLEVPVADLSGLLAEESVHVWIDSWGVDNPEAVQLARQLFGFHPLVIDDCFEAREHPKVEPFPEYIFLITHGIAPDAHAEDAETIELDVFLGKRFLFTYHERPSRSVAGTADLVRRNQGGPLTRGPGAVLHAILDRQVDSMEPLVDQVETRIEEVEDRVLVRPGSADLVTLLALKRNILKLRRWMTKQREVVLRLARNEFALVDPREAVHFRDIYDHLYRFTELLETHREMTTSLQEAYLSITNLRLAEIMKFLTLFTAVLMPLTLITGIYGMNFDHMPELRRSWGYPAVLGLMVLVAGSILIYFRRKGWLGLGRLGGIETTPPADDNGQ